MDDKVKFMQKRNRSYIFDARANADIVDIMLDTLKTLFWVFLNIENNERVFFSKRISIFLCVSPTWKVWVLWASWFW